MPIIQVQRENIPQNQELSLFSLGSDLQESILGVHHIPKHSPGGIPTLFPQFPGIFGITFTIFIQIVLEAESGV